MFVGLNPPPPIVPDSKKQMVLPEPAEIALRKLEEIQAKEASEKKDSSKKSKSIKFRVKASSKDFHKS